ncbi:hypothetical protein GCM10020219_077700 [Nonomuraea dietziae]
MAGPGKRYEEQSRGRNGSTISSIDFKHESRKGSVEQKAEGKASAEDSNHHPTREHASGIARVEEQTGNRVKGIRRGGGTKER